MFGFGGLYSPTIPSIGIFLHQLRDKFLQPTHISFDSASLELPQVGQLAPNMWANENPKADSRSRE